MERDLEMVCKIDHKSKEETSKKAHENAMNRWTSQVYSAFMAKLYRQLSCEFDAIPLYFLPPMLYELDSKFMGTNLIYAEPFIDKNVYGEWQRYTNNYDYVKR